MSGKKKYRVKRYIEYLIQEYEEVNPGEWEWTGFQVVEQSRPRADVLARSLTKNPPDEDEKRRMLR